MHRQQTGSRTGERTVSTVREMVATTDELIGVAGAFGWLSRTLWVPLSEEAVSDLVGGTALSNLEEYLEALGVDAAPHIAAMRRALGDGGSRVLERLNVESTYLFRLGTKEPPAPPYESVWVTATREVLGPSVHDVLTAYFEAGVQVDKTSADLVADHVAREAEFVSFVCREAVKAEMAGSHSDADEWIRRASRFLRNHVMEWTPRFFDAVVSTERSEFFSAVAEIGNALVASEPVQRIAAYGADAS